jgi:hypothetical protein
MVGVRLCMATVIGVCKGFSRIVFVSVLKAWVLLH